MNAAKQTIIKHDIFFYVTPEELRDLANKMEKTIPKLNIGQSCTIEKIKINEETTLHISWDF